MENIRQAGRICGENAARFCLLKSFEGKALSEEKIEDIVKKIEKKK